MQIAVQAFAWLLSYEVVGTSATITWGPTTHRTGTTFRSVTTVTVMHLDSAWQRSTRTLENALRTLLRKPQIFIQTVLANIYPETGFGS